MGLGSIPSGATNFMFEFKLTKDGYRLYDTETKKQFGEIFQEEIKSPEAKASLIVFEKYKRNFNLQYEDLKYITEFVINFAEDRKDQGKKCSNDFLTQIASAEIKRKYK